MQQSIISDYVISDVNKFTLKGALVESDTLESQVGVYFDIVQEHSVSLQSQITDNYMENNTAIADHIANNPITVSLRGVSGEVVYKPSITEESTQGLAQGGLLTDLYNTANAKYGTKVFSTEKLTDIALLYPPVDNVTQLAKNLITSVEDSFKRYEKILKDFTSPVQKETRLREIYLKLWALRDIKTSLTVYTPYETFENMYIHSITLRQGNEKHTSDIELNLKQVYFAETQTTKADNAVLDKYNQWQRASVENHGKMQGVNTNNSILYERYGNKAPYKNYSKG